MTNGDPRSLSSLLDNTGGTGIPWSQGAIIASAVCAAIEAQRGTPVHLQQLSWSGVHLTISPSSPDHSPLAYSAPEWTKDEQLPAQATYNAASIIAHLLSGEHPFAAESAHAQRVRKLLQEPAPLPANVPIDVQHALQAALSPDPEARPPSPRALLTRLTSTYAATDKSALATPNQLPRTDRQHRRSVAILLACTSIFAVLATFASSGLSPKDTEPPAPISAKEASRTDDASPDILEQIPADESLLELNDGSQDQRAAPTASSPASSPSGSSGRPRTDPLRDRPAHPGSTEDDTNSDESINTPRTELSQPTPAAPASAPRSEPMPEPEPQLGAAVEEEPETRKEEDVVSEAAETSGKKTAPSSTWRLITILGSGFFCALMGVLGFALLAGALLLWRPSRYRDPAPTFPFVTSRGGQPASVLQEGVERPQFQAFSLGGYRCVGELGEGGMGVVYAAEHVGLQRRCALKVLSPGGSALPISMELFQREARMAARVNHPNVVTIYDFGEAPGALFYLAMELVEGQDLSRVRKPMRLERVLEITRQLCEGLDAAHSAGVLHRDLKPSNVLLSQDHHGQDLIKILDFGLARPSGAKDASLMDGFIIGTPEWMSPEQARGALDLDERSDIFSLALIVYAMLTGHPAYQVQGQTPLQVVFQRAQVAGPPPRPSQLRPALSPRIDAAVLRALSPEPSDRPRSVQAFYASLVV